MQYHRSRLGPLNIIRRCDDVALGDVRLEETKPFEKRALKSALRIFKLTHNV
jgi:hypothetical protein